MTGIAECVGTVIGWQRLQRRDRAGRVQDPLQPLVLGLDERGLVGELAVVADVVRRAPGEHERGDDRDPDRHLAGRRLVDQPPAAERDGDAEADSSSDGIVR